MGYFLQTIKPWFVWGSLHKPCMLIGLVWTRIIVIMGLYLTTDQWHVPFSWFCPAVSNITCIALLQDNSLHYCQELGKRRVIMITLFQHRTLFWLILMYHSIVLWNYFDTIIQSSPSSKKQDCVMFWKPRIIKRGRWHTCDSECILSTVCSIITSVSCLHKCMRC